MDESKRDLANTNRRAWDELYGSTEELVWGAHPLQFIGDFLSPYAGTFGRILDAGTGEGRNLPLLLDLNAAETHACDASPQALAKVPAAVAARVKLEQCDVTELPYPDHYFDLLVSIDVVETLPNAHQVLQEFRRVLAPGGLLLCNIPGEEDSVAGVDMTSIGERSYLFRDNFYYQFLDEDAAVALLEGAGFHVREMKLCSWVEEPHPNFRGEPHQHTSRVFLSARTD